ncbi:MAG: hypothetical protein NT067_06665 [Candidatus Diapherotrites archaeon]|nr:hypothetical protein [Candidatus Diapherotrites archaeon]
MPPVLKRGFISIATGNEIFFRRVIPKLGKGSIVVYSDPATRPDYTTLPGVNPCYRVGIVQSVSSEGKMEVVFTHYAPVAFRLDAPRPRGFNNSGTPQTLIVDAKKLEPVAIEARRSDLKITALKGKIADLGR